MSFITVIMKYYDNIIVTEYKKGYLLYNPYTDSVKYVDDLKEDLAAIKKLIDEGVLMDTNIDGSSIARFIIDKSKISHFRELQITDAFSYVCNLACEYCMQQNIKENKTRMSPEKRVEEWQQLMKLHHANYLSVCLFGGEPFYNVSYISKLLEIAKEQLGEVNYSVVTNGTLIDERVIRLINDFEISRIQITIDGPEGIHNNRRKSSSINCYEEIIKNIQNIIEKTNATVIINSVIDTANYNYIDVMTDELIETFNREIYSDQPRIVFNYGMECHPYGNSDYTNEHIPEIVKFNVDFLTIYKRQILKGIAVTEVMPTPLCILKDENDILISPNGDIYKCITGLGANEFKVCSYSDLWDKKLLYFEKLASLSYQQFPSCVNCKYLALCNGGCYYDAVLQGKKQICRKKVLDATISQLIELRYITKEIELGVFRYDNDIINK